MHTQCIYQNSSLVDLEIQNKVYEKLKITLIVFSLPNVWNIQVRSTRKTNKAG